MEPIIGITVIGAKELIAKLKANPDRVKKAVSKEMTAQMGKLVNYIKTRKLVGGHPLHQRHGNLSGSVKFYVRDSNDYSVGFVTAGNNSVCKYAAIHEYGFTGTETVRAHTRTITQAFGRTIAPVSVNVRSFPRRMNMPERSFMRSSLMESTQTIRQGFNAAIIGVLR